MSIPTVKRTNSTENHSGIIVPGAAVWMRDFPVEERSHTVHVRTLDSSNVLRFEPPRGLRLQGHNVSNTTLPKVRSDRQESMARPAQGNDVRSISETLKQWAGGAIFGATIFVGILMSQSADEDTVPSFSESRMAGLETSH